MKLKVNANDLLKWSRYLDELPRRTKPAIARALNTFGEGVVHEIVNYIAQKNSWDPDDVRRRILVKEADPHDLSFTMDASLVVPQSQQWQRPWAERDNAEFEQNTLVKIVTQDDGYDCDVCRQIAEQGPYTMDQVVQMQAQWADYNPPTPNIHPGVITNLVHPRCRCVTQPWSSYRRLAVSIQGQSGQANTSSGPPTRLMTVKQLSKILHDDMQLEIKVLNRRYS